MSSFLRLIYCHRLRCSSTSLSPPFSFLNNAGPPTHFYMCDGKHLACALWRTAHAVCKTAWTCVFSYFLNPNLKLKVNCSIPYCLCRFGFSFSLEVSYKECLHDLLKTDSTSLYMHNFGNKLVHLNFLSLKTLSSECRKIKMCWVYTSEKD